MKTAAALLLLAGWQLGAGAQNFDECGPSSNAEYQYEVIPTDGFEIRWRMNVDDDSISFQVVSSAAAWTSVGFSSNGAMVGSDAVIGLPDDASVLEYDMTGKLTSNVVPFDFQEITGGSVSQDASGTTVTFTRSLSPTGDKQTISPTPGDETILIYAYGKQNALGFHGQEPRAGDLVLDLYCGDARISDGGAATVAGTPAPVAVVVETLNPTTPGSASPTEAPAAAGDGDRGDVTTKAPSTADDGVGQGDSDGAFHVGGAGWVSMAATGVVMVVGVVVL